jgi:hypothetical protein
MLKKITPFKGELVQFYVGVSEYKTVFLRKIFLFVLLVNKKGLSNFIFS